MAIGWSADGLTAELFKYIDDNGVTVLNDHVPPDFVKNGYTILDEAGGVLKIVPRALTKEEIGERDRQIELDEKKRKEIADREAADATLLKLYSSPDAVNRARDAQVAGVQGFVSSARSNLQRLLNQKRRLEASVANTERADESIPQENLDRIASVEARIEQIRAEIDSKLAEMEQLKQDYASDLKRVLELYSLPAESS